MMQALRSLKNWLRDNLPGGLEAIDAGPPWLGKQHGPSWSAK